MFQHRLRELIANLEFEFNDWSLLWEAFTHRSYLNEAGRGENAKSYERLECLGDRVIELVVVDWLFDEFPEYEEGPISRMKARIVSTNSLGEIGRNMNLGSYTRMSRGEERERGRNSTKLCCDLLEAFIGAIYKDQGVGAARIFIDYLLLKNARSILQKGRIEYDPKGLLMEIVQAQGCNAPTYTFESKSGSDHEPVFTYSAVAMGRTLASGSGPNKKLAQANAAKAALLTHFKPYIREHS